MGEDVMEIRTSKSDESLMEDLSPKPPSSSSLSPSGGSPPLGESAAYQYRSAACLALALGVSVPPFWPLPRGILIGQRKGPLRGRVCGGRVACVVGDDSKERSAESGPRGRGTWLPMARRRRLAHIEKSSMASALDRARQHVMGVSPLSNLEESSGGYTGHVRKVWEFVAWRGPRWNWKESVLPKKWIQLEGTTFWCLLW
ncbi:hypothetical protein TNCV_3568861 [Trichonephila clavipes]|nr:hypothetical protein TNCV_3568861 [Trichonephila clavipes]